MGAKTPVNQSSHFSEISYRVFFCYQAVNMLDISTWGLDMENDLICSQPQVDVWETAVFVTSVLASLHSQGVCHFV